MVDVSVCTRMEREVVIPLWVISTVGWSSRAPMEEAGGGLELMVGGW